MRAGLLAAWMVLCLAAGSAGAQQAAAGGQSREASDDEVARGLFQAGKAAYEGGNYAEAVNFFEQAHVRSRRPQLLFNIGQAADRARQDEKAVISFRAYLEQVPDATNRAEVEARVAG